MSTYHFIICNDCKEKTHAASRTAGGYCHVGDSDKTLLPFIIVHSGHNTEIISEHRDEVYSDEFTHWTEQNVSELYKAFTDNAEREVKKALSRRGDYEKELKCYRLNTGGTTGREESE